MPETNLFLYRPRKDSIFNRLRCHRCEGINFEVCLLDDGNWTFECECGEEAITLSDAVNLLKPEPK